MKMVVISTSLLIGCCIYFATLMYNSSLAIDFYQYWGVGAAQKLSGGVLSNPYVNVKQYDSFLDKYSTTSGDERLRLSNIRNHMLYRQSLDVNATPLLYALFALFPAKFSLSYGIFLALMVVVLLPVSYLFCHYPRPSAIPVLLGILFVFYHEPLRADAQVGNLNTLQFFSMAVLTYFIAVLIDEQAERQTFFRDAAVLSGIVLLILLKPNFLIIGLALSASVFVKRSARAFSKAAAAAASVGILLFLIPCIYFNSWSVWNDWFGYLSLGSGKISRYNVQEGNFATSVIVSNLWDFSVNSTMVLICAVLMISLMLCLGTERIVKKVGMILHNPYLAVVMAVSATLALSPLVWFHYYVISLLPAIWMTMQPLSTPSRYLGGFSLFLSSGLIVRMLDVNEYLPFVFASSWVPLWIGALVLISSMKPAADDVKIVG